MKIYWSVVYTCTTKALTSLATVNMPFMRAAVPYFALKTCPSTEASVDPGAGADASAAFDKFWTSSVVGASGAASLSSTCFSTSFTNVLSCSGPLHIGPATCEELVNGWCGLRARLTCNDPSHSGHRPSTGGPGAVLALTFTFPDGLCVFSTTRPSGWA